MERPPAASHDDDGFELPDLTTGSGLSGEWVRRIYYGLGYFWLGTGVIMLAMLLIGRAMADKSGSGSLDPGTLIIGLLLFIRILVAIGYLKRIQSVMNLVNVLAFLGLVGSLFGLVMNILSIMVLGLFAVIGVVLSLVDVAVNGGIMWIIGESDRPDAFP